MDRSQDTELELRNIGLRGDQLHMTLDLVRQREATARLEAKQAADKEAELTTLARALQASLAGALEATLQFQMQDQLLGMVQSALTRAGITNSSSEVVCKV